MTTDLGQSSEIANSGCRNCGVLLNGAYCHACGQSARLPQRLGDGMVEAIRLFTHFDGRFWSTIRLLLRDPGRLSREWGGGRRMAYMPPVQLLLLSALLFGAPLFVAFVRDGGFNLDRASHSFQSGFGLTLWAERNLLLLIPAALVALHAVAPRKGGVSFYGHGAVVFYQLSFLLLTGGAAIVLGAGLLGPLDVGSSSLVLLLPALWLGHFVLHLRGAYATSWPGAVVRTAAFLVVFAFVLMSLSLLAAPLWETLWGPPPAEVRSIPRWEEGPGRG